MQDFFKSLGKKQKTSDRTASKAQLHKKNSCLMNTPDVFELN